MHSFGTGKSLEQERQEWAENKKKRKEQASFQKARARRKRKKS